MEQLYSGFFNCELVVIQPTLILMLNAINAILNSTRIDLLHKH